MFIGKRLGFGEQSPKSDQIKVFKFSSENSYGSIVLSGEGQMSRRLGESRKYLRLDRSFEVSLHKVGVHAFFEGLTKNISQGGAFIRTKDWSAFQENDQALVTFYLPPKFTGQDVIIRLLGTAIIKRIDRENEGLGLQFNERLRQFERVH